MTGQLPCGGLSDARFCFGQKQGGFAAFDFPQPLALAESLT